MGDTFTAPPATEKPSKGRKAKYRNRDIVLGCIEERLSCFVVDGVNVDHIERLTELLDELKRSLSGKEEAGE